MYCKEMLLLLLGSICLLLSGCAGAPVGWGGTWELWRYSPEYIEIKIDTSVAYTSEADRAASEHCNKYNRVARLKSVEGGVVSYRTYSCIKPISIVSKDCGFIVIEYHGDYVGFEEIYNIAKRHCSSCEKKAQPPQIANTESRTEDTRIVTVKCE